MVRVVLIRITAGCRDRDPLQRSRTLSPCEASAVWPYAGARRHGTPNPATGAEDTDKLGHWARKPGRKPCTGRSGAGRCDRSGGLVAGLGTGDEFVVGVEDGLRRAQSPTIPSTTTRAPGWMPGMRRRPWNTRSNLPESSARMHSRLEVPALGWTRTDLIRPATRTRVRHLASPIGVVPRPRSPNAVRSKAALTAASRSEARSAARAALVGRAATLAGWAGCVPRRHSRRRESQPPVSW